MCTINFVEADVPHVAAERQRRRSLSAGRRLSDLEMLKKVRILFILFMYIKESLFANNAHTWLCSLFFSTNTLQRNSHACIPFLGIARPQSQFPHSCVWERFIYIPRIGPHIFLQQNMVIDGGNYLNRSRTHECGNWVSFLGNFVSNFRHWFFAVYSIVEDKK
jgi:hypothetical protein